MSQQKVDRYKAEKAHRKEIIRKEKMKKMLNKCILAAAGLALVGWLGYSAYDSYQAKQPRVTSEVNYDAFSNYLNELNTVE